MSEPEHGTEWQVLKSEIIFQDWVTVVRDMLRKPDGSVMPFRYVGGGEAAVALAFTAQNQVVLTQQYRHPLRRTILDLPGGGIHEGETPQEAARRELSEETGYVAGSVQKLGHYAPLPGMIPHVCHVFVARDLTPGPNNLDEHEVIDVVLVDWDEVVEMVLSNEAIDGPLSYAVLRYLATESMR